MKYYSGKFHPKNPKKYGGDSTNIIFRSLWEFRVMKYLDENSSVIEWKSEEIPIPYYDPSTMKHRRYFPDFIVKAKAAKGGTKTLMLEVKPKKQTLEPKVQKKKTRSYITEVTTWATNQAKWKAAEEFCLDNGWDFVMITEDELGIK